MSKVRNLTFLSIFPFCFEQSTSMNHHFVIYGVHIQSQATYLFYLKPNVELGTMMQWGDLKLGELAFRIRMLFVIQLPANISSEIAGGLSPKETQMELLALDGSASPFFVWDIWEVKHLFLSCLPASKNIFFFLINLKNRTKLEGKMNKKQTKVNKCFLANKECVVSVSY